MKRTTGLTFIFFLSMVFCLSSFAASAWGAAWHVSPNGSDATGNGSPSNPFSTIQHGIEAASDGDDVRVAQGVYDENVVIAGKALGLLGGYEDTGWTRDMGSYRTVIDGENRDTGLRVNSPVLVEGFTIQNGQVVGDQGGGGVEISGGPSEIRYCIVQNNHGSGLNEWGAGGILAYSDCGTLRVTGCTIVDNHTTGGAGGIRSGGCELIMAKTLVARNTGRSAVHLDTSTGTFRNCTIANNPDGGVLFNQSPVALTNCIVWGNGWNNYGPCTITYSDIRGGFPGQGNILLNPLFCDPANGDFAPAQNSPCIDSGEGGANMGAFDIGCGAILPSYPPPRIDEAMVFSVKSPGQPDMTLFYARVSGPSPEDVASFTATGPAGTFSLNPRGIFQQKGLYYTGGFEGIGVNGLYTFNLMDGFGRTVSVARDFNYNPNIPHVNPASMTPLDRAYTGTIAPTLSFDPLGGDFLYQVFVWDMDGNAIWYTGEKKKDPSFTVPDGLLQPNTPYRWTAMVWDTITQNRSETAPSYFYTGTKGVPEIDMRGVLSFPWNENLLNYPYARGINVAPWDIESFNVTGPKGAVYDLLMRRYYRFYLPMYYAGIVILDPPTTSIPDGTYTFEIRDNLGQTDSDTKDYGYNPIPDFESDAMLPANNAYFDTDTPTFTWSRIAGDPGDGTYRYDLRIMDYFERVRWYDSPYSMETSFTLPAGLNLPKGTYKWQVNVIDTNSNNFRSSSNPAYRTFTLNPFRYPAPDIKVNNQDGPVFVNPSTASNIGISLDPGNLPGEQCDWWIGVLTTFGTYWFTYPSCSWVPSGAPICVGQFGLMNLAPYQVLSYNLPTGIYTFFFILDHNLNGVLDDLTWYDYVNVFSSPDGLEMETGSGFAPVSEDVFLTKIRALMKP